jgi:dihydroneopterin aldolase
MYALFLRDHEVQARIGVHDFEQTAPQRLIINVSLAVRGRPGGDQLADTTDYDFVRRAVSQILSAGQIGLQETVCDQLIAACKAQGDVAAALVSTEKPDVYPDAAAVGCRMLWLADDADPAQVSLLFTRAG